MKNKIITTATAIVLAILVIVIYQYVNSPGYQYKRDLKNAETFYQNKEYEKAATVYLKLLEEKEDEVAKDGLVKCYLSMARQAHEAGDDTKAKEFLLAGKVFDQENEEINSCLSEWFPIRPYEVPLENLMTGLFEGDSKKMFSAFYPEILAAYVQAYEDAGMTEADFYMNMDAKMEPKADSYYQVQNVEALSFVDMADYEALLLDNYQIEVQVTSGYLLQVLVGLEGNTEVDYVPVYEINGNFYASHDLIGL